MSDLYAPIIEDITLALEDNHIALDAAPDRDVLHAALRDALAPHLQRAWKNGRATGHLDGRGGVDTRRNPYTLQEGP